ncbi:hypothetical protein L345_12847, partial [Ophiophagus hannah]
MIRQEPRLTVLGPICNDHYEIDRILDSPMVEGAACQASLATPYQLTERSPTHTWGRGIQSRRDQAELAPGAMLHIPSSSWRSQLDELSGRILDTYV